MHATPWRAIRPRTASTSFICSAGAMTVAQPMASGSQMSSTVRNNSRIS